jgi:chromosome partitioning protein
MEGSEVSRLRAMARIVCVANQKGGVGKTTTAVSLASALVRSGQKVLLVDLDPQCNATSAVGMEVTPRHALLRDTNLREGISPTSWVGLDLIPGSRSFRDVDQLARIDGPEAERLRAHLETGTHAYQYVLLDCPPSLGTLTQAALAASSEVLMPIQCEYFAMEGLTQMIHVIRKVMKARDGRLTFGGIVLTMYDPGLELTAEVEREVREFFGEIVFDTVIPRDVALAEAPSHGMAVFDYAPRSRGAYAYAQLCMEVLDRD